MTTAVNNSYELILRIRNRYNNRSQQLLRVNTAIVIPVAHEIATAVTNSYELILLLSYLLLMK
jgi:hypothetical protein